MPNVVIYTDFDGTITQRSGSGTVFSKFYQSLLEGFQESKYNQGTMLDYKNTPLKSSEEVQRLFKEKFGEYDEHFNVNQPDSDMLMSPESVRFFHEVLENDKIKINIITKNRADYIQELLKYHGFSEEEINRIAIKDSGAKYNEVYSDLNQYKFKSKVKYAMQDGERFTPELPPNVVEYIYILDDSKDDFNAMNRAVTEATLQSGVTVRTHNEEPGQFTWSQYLSQIKEDCNQGWDVIVQEKSETRKSVHPSASNEFNYIEDDVPEISRHPSNNEVDDPKGEGLSEILDEYLGKRRSYKENNGTIKEYLHGNFFAGFQKSYTQKNAAITSLKNALNGFEKITPEILAILRDGTLGDKIRAFVKHGNANEIVGQKVNTISDFIAALNLKNDFEPEKEKSCFF